MCNCNFLKALFIVFTLAYSSFSFGQNTIDQNFKSFKNIQLKTDELLNTLHSKTTFPYFIEIDGYELELVPSNIIPASYKSFTSVGENINSDRAIPMKGYTKNGGNVRLTIAPNYVSGLIEIDNDVIYIEPTSYYDKSASKNDFIVYKQSELKDSANKTCGVVNQVVELEKNTTQVNKLLGECFDADYPVAADFSYVDKYGGATGAENQIITVINNVNTDYDDSFADQINFVLTGTFLVTTSSADDPWTSSLDPFVLLPNYAGWGNTFWSGAGIAADVSSLWTNRDFTGATIGLANIGVVCTGSKYNVLQDSPTNANLTRVLTSHELGHNFGYNHDAGGSPFIMAPAVQNTVLWSAPSVTTINAHIASRTCLTTCVPSGATPDIQFGAASSTTNETSTEGSGGLCDQNYTLKQVSISLNTQPSTTINATINVTGGTAVNNKDFSLETTSISFAPGQSTSRIIDIYVYEDHIIEAAETIILGFTVTSGTVNLGANTSHTITIDTDSDGTATGSPETTVLYGNFNFNASSIFRNAQTDGRTRIMYTKEDLNDIGIFAGNLSSLSLFISGKNSTAPFQGFRIGLANTTSTDLSGMPWIATDQKFLTNYSTVLGQNTFNFSSPFFWDGLSNLYIQFCWDNSTSNGSTPDTEQHTIPLVSTSGHLIHFQSFNSAGIDGCDPPLAGFSFYNAPIQPRIEFEYEGIGTFIESEINSSAQSNLSIGELANMFSADNELIAIVENTGAQNIECIETSIHTAGTNKLSAGFGTGSYSAKTYFVEGEQSTAFDLTLFYTDVELATWGAAALDLNIVMSTVPLASATAGQVTIVSPSEVIQDVYGNPQVSYKANFNGYDYFGLTDVEPETPLLNDIENADLVFNTIGRGLLLKDNTGATRRITATNSNIYTSAASSGDSRVNMDIGDIRIVSSGKGLILRKPSGSYVKLTVNNSGNLTYQSLSSLPSTIVTVESGDLEFDQQGKGIVFKSPSGACWRLLVNSSNALSAQPVSNCD